MITCPDCTPPQQYVLEQLQTRAEVTDKTALAVISATSNKSLALLLTFVKGVLLFLMTNAYVVGMVLSNGLLNIVMMVWVSSVKNTVVIHPAWKVKLVT